MEYSHDIKYGRLHSITCADYYETINILREKHVLVNTQITVFEVKECSIRGFAFSSGVKLFWPISVQ
jgi:hypothetical protein